MSSIQLGGASRRALLNLSDIQSSARDSQLRLTTGKRINSVTDDAVAFFKARQLQNQIGDFDNAKGEIQQASSLVRISSTALESVDKLLQNLRGAVQARENASSDVEKDALLQSITTIGKAINDIINDASLGGVNLLNGTTSNVSFSIGPESNFNISGANLISDLSATNLTSIALVDKAVDNLRAEASRLASSEAILQTRLTFTNNFTNNLRIGLDKLTATDLVEEAATLISLQTQESLAFQGIRLSNDRGSDILRLFK